MNTISPWTGKWGNRVYITAWSNFAWHWGNGCSYSHHTQCHLRSVFIVNVYNVFIPRTIRAQTAAITLIGWPAHVSPNDPFYSQCPHTMARAMWAKPIQLAPPTPAWYWHWIHTHHWLELPMFIPDSTIYQYFGIWDRRGKYASIGMCDKQGKCDRTVESMINMENTENLRREFQKRWSIVRVILTTVKCHIEARA